MWSNRWSTMPMHAFPDLRLPRPDRPGHARPHAGQRRAGHPPAVRPERRTSRSGPWATSRATCSTTGRSATRHRRACGTAPDGAGAPPRWPTCCAEALRSDRGTRRSSSPAWAWARPSPMQFHKLTSTDGFIAFDLDDAPAVGVVRLAPKVLRDGAELLARSTTYAAASFGLQVGGASAGINAKPDDRDAALAAFLAGGGGARRVRPLAPRPGRGHHHRRPRPAPEGRAAQRSRSTRPTAGESAVAAALGALGSLDGKTSGHRRQRPAHRGGRRLCRRPTAPRRSRRRRSTPIATPCSWRARPGCSSTTWPPP